jgi:hypothetical protein
MDKLHVDIIYYICTYLTMQDIYVLTRASSCFYLCKKYLINKCLLESGLSQQHFSNQLPEVMSYVIKTNLPCEITLTRKICFPLDTLNKIPGPDIHKSTRWYDGKIILKYSKCNFCRIKICETNIKYVYPIAKIRIFSQFASECNSMLGISNNFDGIAVSICLKMNFYYDNYPNYIGEFIKIFGTTDERFTFNSIDGFTTVDERRRHIWMKSHNVGNLMDAIELHKYIMYLLYI